MTARLVTGAAQAAGAYLLVGSLAGVSAGLSRYPVFAGQALRYTGAAIILLAAECLRLRRRTGKGNSLAGVRAKPTCGDWVLIILLACVGLAGFNICLTEAVIRTSPASAGAVIAAVPVVLALAGPLTARRRPAARLVAAAVLVSGGASVAAGIARPSLPGLAFALGALACEAAFTLLAVPLLPKLGPLRVAGYASAAAAPMLTVTAVIASRRNTLPLPSPAETAMICYLAVAVTAGGFFLIYSAVARLGAARTGLFAGLVPFGAIGSAVLLGAGQVRPADLAGALLVAAGVAAGTRPSITPH